MNPFESKTEAVRPIKAGVFQGTNPFETQKKTDLKTPEGLYNLAVQAGLREEADKMVQRSGGESQKFMSGGFVMDAMDILNASSYGVVGLVKGKGFIEGIKNRESLSDEDALGKFGWQGKVAGFFGDILLDPLTYIAPVKLVSKIPGVAKGAASLSSKLMGELETITVNGQKTFKREGGWTPLTFLADKFVYGFAADPTFLNGVQKTAGRNDSLLADAEKLMTELGKLKPGIFDRTVKQGVDGRMISTPFNELEIDFKREGLDGELDNIKSLYDTRDQMMDRLVELGVVSKDSKEAHWGTYLKQSYDEYLEAQSKKSIGQTKRGIAIEPKKRKEGLTQGMMEELGQVKDAHVLWATTLIKQIDLVKKAELQKYVADGYAMSDDMIDEFKLRGGNLKDLHKIEDAPKYRLGEVDIKNELSSVNKELRTVLKERRAAVKDDKELTAAINKLETELGRLKGSIGDDVGESLAGLKQILRESPSIKPGPMKKVPTSAGQKAVSRPMLEWLSRGSKKDRLARETMSTADLWDEFKLTPGGLAVQRAFEDPRLMYQWRNPIEFMDAIRYPDKAIVYKDAVNKLVDLTDAEQLARIKRAEANARKFGELEQTKKILSETNLELVRDAVDRLEQKYADLLWSRSGILESLEVNKMGQLAGKYISKEAWNVLRGSFEPSKELGENLVLKFKHIKVVWNPGSHVRNAFGAAIQNWWKMGLGPWRLDTYYDATKELKGGKYLDEMKNLGFSERSGYMGELLNNYINNEELMKSAISKQIESAAGVKKYLKKIDRLMMNSYGHTDNVAKMAAYKTLRKKGVSPDKAYTEAMSATFNYSEVTPFVHQMRRAIWGVPFVTFAVKALPLTVSTIANSPGRISVFGKLRNSLFAAAGVEGDQEAEALPEYMRDSMFVMRLPWKDEQGRSMYFDLSYIVPFGSLADGSIMENPASLNPVVQLVKELSRNETFSGNRIFRESDDIDKVLMDISIHVGKMGLPPTATDFISDGYKSDGQKVDSRMGWEKATGINTDDFGPGERNHYQNAMRVIGLGATPFELNSRESSLAYKQKENLTKLLSDNGILKNFNMGYIPKADEVDPLLQPQPSLTNRDVQPLGR